MKLQVINSLNGKAEYVLLPIAVYRPLENEIEALLTKLTKDGDLIPFKLDDYVDNPVALARIKAGLTQEELAKCWGVTQAYISKLEKQPSVSGKTLNKLKLALKPKYRLIN